MERCAWWLIVLLLVASPSLTGVCFAQEDGSWVSMEAGDTGESGGEGAGEAILPARETGEDCGEITAAPADPAADDPAAEAADENPAVEADEEEAAEEAAGKSYVCPQCSFSLDSPGDCPSCNIALVEQAAEPANAPVKKRYYSEPPRGAGNSVTFTNTS